MLMNIVGRWLNPPKPSAAELAAQQLAEAQRAQLEAEHEAESHELHRTCCSAEAAMQKSRIVRLKSRIHAMTQGGE